MPLGDDLDVAVGHLDRGLVVDRVCRTLDIGSPALCIGHGIARHALGVHVRTDREVHDAQRLVAAAGWLPSEKSSPIRGDITMLPALSPTQTISLSDGRRSASPDSRIQWHRYRASPPEASSTSVSRTRGTQRSSSMLGSA